MRSSVVIPIASRLPSVFEALRRVCEITHIRRRREIGLFRDRKPATLAALKAGVETRSLKAGEHVFSKGDAGDELFLIRRGSVRIVLPFGENRFHHVATFGRVDFFDEMSFLVGNERSAIAVIEVDVELYVLSRARFDSITAAHHMLAISLLESQSRVLALYLRYANVEIRAMQASWRLERDFPFKKILVTILRELFPRILIFQLGRVRFRGRHAVIANLLQPSRTQEKDAHAIVLAIGGTIIRVRFEQTPEMALFPLAMNSSG